MNNTDHIPIISLVGVPNVGKSSLVNRLLGSRATIIHDQSHTTRDTTQHRIELGDKTAYLQDTPGFGNTKDPLVEVAQHQLINALKTSDIILFVVDSTQISTTEAEKSLARIVRSQNKPTFLLLNKSDKITTGTDHFKALGFETTLSISAHHGDGIEELKTSIVEKLPAPPKQSPPNPFLKIAILGRPNVGKSSLVNTLSGETTAIVSEIAGTTRDPVNITITYNHKQLLLTDTAGLRKPGKIGRDIEYFSLARTRQIVNGADVCILVVDATEVATSQDQRIAGIIREAGKGLVLAVNKSDELTGEDRQSLRLERRLQREFEFVWWAPYVLISAKTGKNLDKLIEQVCQVGERTQQKLRTKEINDALQEAISAKPPASAGNLRPKLNYATQTGNLPLEITIYGTHPEAIHFSYRRYLENRLRQKFDLHGVPIKLIFKSKYGSKDDIR